MTFRLWRCFKIVLIIIGITIITKVVYNHDLQSRAYIDTAQSKGGTYSIIKPWSMVIMTWTYSTICQCNVSDTAAKIIFAWMQSVWQIHCLCISPPCAGCGAKPNMRPIWTIFHRSNDLQSLQNRPRLIAAAADQMIKKESKCWKLMILTLLDLSTSSRVHIYNEDI